MTRDWNRGPPLRVKPSPCRQPVFLPIVGTWLVGIAALGIPAIVALVIVFWLMVAKPV